MQLLDQKLKAALLGGDVSYNALRKEAFHRAGKVLLRRIAKALGLDKKQYDLCSNLAGIAVSGEITLHSDTLYLQLSQGALMQGRTQILYRRCDGRKDYVGHMNHFVEVARLVNEDEAKRFILACDELATCTHSVTNAWMYMMHSGAL